MLLSAFIIFFTACKKDNDKPNETGIRFTSSYLTASPSGSQRVDSAGVALVNFIINVEEIEIEFDDDDPLFASDSVASDVELAGPFVINLMQNGDTLASTIANGVNLPPANYDEIEFKFREGQVANSPMNGKSVYASGTIHGTPFEFWSDNEAEVEVEFDTPVSLDAASTAVLTISFNLSALFNPALGGIDISGATDGNNDGTIQIYPGDPDGNSSLASDIWSRLEDIIDAFEDRDDD